MLIVDDVLATGGTAAAKAMLVEKMGATVAGFAFLIELDFLGGREKLGEPQIVSLIHVDLTRRRRCPCQTAARHDCRRPLFACDYCTGATISTWTVATPPKPSAEQPPSRGRGRVPSMYGPRSFTYTMTRRSPRVSASTVPKGSVREAQVKSSSLKIWPEAVPRPLNPGPYQLADGREGLAGRAVLARHVGGDDVGARRGGCPRSPSLAGCRSRSGIDASRHCCRVVAVSLRASSSASRACISQLRDERLLLGE